MPQVRARFLEEATHDVCIGLVLDVEDLERDLAVERFVVRREDDAKATLAELAAQRVLADL